MAKRTRKRAAKRGGNKTADGHVAAPASQTPEPSKLKVDAPGRGKQRREALRAERNANAVTVDPASPQTPPEEPAFWFGFEVTWAKLLLGRFIFFGLLAVDALLNFAHAPRYGAGDFNVAQLPLFDLLMPTRTSYAVGQLLCAWL